MASGDRLCPNCGQWQIHCRCGWAAAAANSNPWLPATVSYKPEELTMQEIALLRNFLSALDRKESSDPGWFERTFGVKNE